MLAASEIKAWQGRHAHVRAIGRKEARVSISGWVCAAGILTLSACSQQFAVSINDQTVFDPRPGAAQYRFADAGLQACVNFALQQPGATFETLAVLSCPGWEIEDIEGIGALTTLQFLDVSNNSISSLAPLSALPRLSGLSAADNQITDIAPLFSLNSLASAVLTGNDGILCRQLDTLQERLQRNLGRPAECRG